jgi:2,3-dihydroxy-p-cumate/2,3-dihydroxybenzoate 3,4-dioxygenase
VIRCSKLAYVELNVSDLARSRRFYEDIVGLQPVATGHGGELLYRCSDDHHSFVLHQGSAPSLKRVGFFLEDESQLAVLQASLDRHGTSWEEVPAREREQRFLGRTLRMVEPHTGATFEFGLPLEGKYRFEPTLAKIQRLGHVVLWTTQAEEACAYLTQALNFRTSDEIGPNATFMRPFPTPYHHGVGVFKGKRRGLHHINFMVTEIDDVGRGFNRLRANNVPIAKGIGRHPVSGSVFLYYFDPDGITLEYSFGMEQFSEVDPRAPTRWPFVPASFDSWDAPIHPDYPATSEIENPVGSAADAA